MFVDFSNIYLYITGFNLTWVLTWFKKMVEESLPWLQAKLRSRPGGGDLLLGLWSGPRGEKFSRADTIREGICVGILDGWHLRCSRNFGGMPKVQRSYTKACPTELNFTESTSTNKKNRQSWLISYCGTNPHKTCLIKLYINI